MAAAKRLIVAALALSWAISDVNAMFDLFRISR